MRNAQLPSRNWPSRVGRPSTPLSVGIQALLLAQVAHRSTISCNLPKLDTTTSRPFLQASPPASCNQPAQTRLIRRTQRSGQSAPMCLHGASSA